MSKIDKIFIKLERQIKEADTSETRRVWLLLMTKLNDLRIQVEEYHKLPAFKKNKEEKIIKQTAIGDNNNLTINENDN